MDVAVHQARSCLVHGRLRLSDPTGLDRITYDGVVIIEPAHYARIHERSTRPASVKNLVRFCH
jgi:hypothetical protein